MYSNAFYGRPFVNLGEEECCVRERKIEKRGGSHLSTSAILNRGFCVCVCVCVGVV